MGEREGCDRRETEGEGEGVMGELEGGGQIKQCSLPCESFMLLFELYICFHK